MSATENAHLSAWIKTAGYDRHPFKTFYAEQYDKEVNNDEKTYSLEVHFTPHKGYFEEYSSADSVIIVGAPGSGKTVNRKKLYETLKNNSANCNFIILYNPEPPKQIPATSINLKHHLCKIVCLGTQQLLDAKADFLSREAERELRRLNHRCQTFFPRADYRSRLDSLRQKALEAGYKAVYLLIDEQQVSRREPAKTPELLSPLLDESLFNLEKLHIKLFIPDALLADAQELQHQMDEQVRVIQLEWTEANLAELLKASLRGALQEGTYTSRAEELGRLTLIRDIDQQFVRAVAINAPLPRELIRLGHTLFSQCASHWTSDQRASIGQQDWTTALKTWHQSLAAEKLVSQPVIFEPLRIEFTDCEGKRVKAYVDDSKHQHELDLPYDKDNDLWAVLWALERFALDELQLPSDAPYIDTLCKLGLVQYNQDAGAASAPKLVSDLLERVGESLYKYLFKKPGLDRFLKESEKATRELQQEGINDARVWLELRFNKETADLACFPWELLRHDDVFLCQTGHFELTRYHYVEGHKPQLRLNRPLRLLYIAPRVGLDSLDYDRPYIKQAFPSNHLRLQEVEPPSYERLQQEVESLAYQAVHYDSHGTFGHYCSKCQKFFPPGVENCPEGHLSPPLVPCGYLQFEDQYGQLDPRPAHDVLSALYHSAGYGVKFVLINACKSSTQVSSSAFGGITPALARAGVPAVVGMLASIEEKAARVFVQAFYKVLGAALQRQNLSGMGVARVLARAVSKGRKNITGDSECSSSRNCWWIPTLNLSYSKEERNE